MADTEIQQSSGIVEQDPRPLKKPLPVIRVGADLALLVITWFCLETVSRLIGPYERGIFCDDESIRLPYRTNTVNTLGLFAFCFLTPAIAILATETYYLFKSTTSSLEYLLEYERGRTLYQRLGIRFCFFQGYFFLAFVVTLLLTIFTKFPVGRLRPHFLDVCKPNINLSNCAQYGHNYITDFSCTNVNGHAVMEARLSFFSGHSSLSLCSTTFTVLYLQFRLHGKLWSNIALPVLQAFVLAMGLFIAYSRIFDHMHHWSDVLIGMFVGVYVAMIVVLGLAKFQNISTHATSTTANGVNKYTPATVATSDMPV